MDYDKLITKLVGLGTVGALTDALTLCDELINLDAAEVLDRDGSTVADEKNPENVKRALEYLLLVRRKCAEYLRKGDSEAEHVYWSSLRIAAKYDFDCFCRFIEKDREPKKRFYEPRRKQLYHIAKALQRLENDELDLLAISMPPGTGKTGLAIFYIAWQSGLHPDMQNLIGSHNNEFLRGVYDECIRIFDRGGEYCWSEVFNGVSVRKTNAKSLRIDLGRPKRFETIELTSLKAGNAGKVRATNLLYCDDLCEGIEQALSAERMNKLWQDYTVDLRQRKLGDRVKELHIQTRWSVNDIVGRLQEIYEESPRAEFINIPAYDENGESAFEYPYGLGYTKEMLQDLEQSMDDASFNALYLGQPIEREGRLYHPDELRRYFELPEREPDAILSVCDTKDRGEDFCVMPIIYQYGQDYYIEDVVCDNGKPEIVEAKLVEKMIQHKIQMSRFESNAAGGRVAQKVQEEVRERGGITKITTKYNQKNKETRIITASPYVKEHFLFKDESKTKSDKEYKTFLSQLCSYTMSGRNKHDDVCDAMAQCAEYLQNFSSGRVQVFQRPW